MLLNASPTTLINLNFVKPLPDLIQFDCCKVFVIVQSQDLNNFFFSLKDISVEAISTIAMALKTNHSLQILK